MFEEWNPPVFLKNLNVWVQWERKPLDQLEVKARLRDADGRTAEIQQSATHDLQRKPDGTLGFVKRKFYTLLKDLDNDYDTFEEAAKVAIALYLM